VEKQAKYLIEITIKILMHVMNLQRVMRTIKDLSISSQKAQIKTLPTYLKF